MLGGGWNDGRVMDVVTKTEMEIIVMTRDDLQWDGRMEGWVGRRKEGKAERGCLTPDCILSILKKDLPFYAD